MDIVLRLVLSGAPWGKRGKLDIVYSVLVTPHRFPETAATKRGIFKLQNEMRSMLFKDY